jgi:hypothetical protein
MRIPENKAGHISSEKPNKDFVKLLANWCGNSGVIGSTGESSASTAAASTAAYTAACTAATPPTT